MTAATPRFLSLSLSYPSFSRRTPGPRDRRALDGNQKDIEPPRAPRHGGCCSSRELKHRAGGISAALRSALWQRHHRGSWALAFAVETSEEGGGAESGRAAWW